MRKIIFVLFILNAAVYPIMSLAESTIEKCSNNDKLLIYDLEFAASIAGDDNFERGIYIFNLKCAVGSWSLNRLSLNKCDEGKDGISSFTPKVDEWGYSKYQVESKQIADNKFEISVFQTDDRQFPAKIILTFEPDSKSFKKLDSLIISGFTDVTLLPNKKTAIDYNALVNERYKQLDCPMLLPGLN